MGEYANLGGDTTDKAEESRVRRFEDEVAGNKPKRRRTDDAVGMRLPRNRWRHIPEGGARRRAHERRSQPGRGARQRC